MKRGRSYDWTLTLEDSSPFRNILDAASAVSGKVVLKVVDINDQYYITVDCTSASKSCNTACRMKVNTIDFADGKKRDLAFCIECSHMLNCIDIQCCMHGMLKIQGNEDDSKLFLKMYDPDRPSYCETAELMTYVDDDDHQRNKVDMKFDYVVEFDASRMRELLRHAKKSFADYMRMKVYIEGTGSVQYSRLSFTISGNWTSSQHFRHPITRNEDGSVVVSGSVDGEDDEWEEGGDDTSLVYNALFGIEKMDAFFKNLPCKSIKGRVSKNVNFMMLTHCLRGGDENDEYIRFLIGICNEDD